MRTNLRDSVKPEMLAPGTKARIVARNMFQFTAPNGDKVTRLHNTDIVRVTPKGKTILHSGGWRTSTTKDRMNCYSGPDIRLCADKGSWYVSNGNGAVPYYDGITVPDCFNSKAIAKGKAAEAREQKLRGKVRAFVNKLDKLECLPNPSPGDCWLCCMKDKAGTSMGELGGQQSDAEHIRKHVQEGYLHGSLIVNALTWAGYPNPQLIGAMDNADMKRGKKPMFTKRALKRFLYRKLGLAA